MINIKDFDSSLQKIDEVISIYYTRYITIKKFMNMKIFTM